MIRSGKLGIRTVARPIQGDRQALYSFSGGASFFIGFAVAICLASIPFSAAAQIGPGYALSFDGVNDYVDFGSVVGNFGTSDFTIEFWIKNSVTYSQDQDIIAKRPVCGHSSFFDVTLHSAVTMEVDGDTSGTGYGSVSTPLNPGLAMLGNYGGPTQTSPLVPGSPAIDAGDDALLNAPLSDHRHECARLAATLLSSAVAVMPVYWSSSD